MTTPQLGDTRIDQYGQEERYLDLFADGNPEWQVTVPKPLPLEYICTNDGVDTGCGKVFKGEMQTPQLIASLKAERPWPMPGICPKCDKSEE